MCLVIDTNTLAAVFDPKASNHEEFKFVSDWIYDGKGKIVFGGSKYKEELSKTKYLSLFTQLNIAGKSCKANDMLVDEEAKTIETILQHPNFDDQHIVALLRITGCKLICSDDKRAHPYFRHNLFFKTASVRPKIYTGKRNKDLLNDNNIAEFCKPNKVLNKDEKVNYPNRK